MLMSYASSSVTFQGAVRRQGVHPEDVHAAISRRLGIGDAEVPGTLTWSTVAVTVADGAVKQAARQRADATTEGMLFSRLLAHGGVPGAITTDLGLSFDTLRDAFSFDIS
jgi:hypothetical protein